MTGCHRLLSDFGGLALEIDDGVKVCDGRLRFPGGSSLELPLESDTGLIGLVSYRPEYT